jgi:Mg-chelatase subunit ChlD
LHACLAGLQAHLGELLTAIDAVIVEDPDIETVSAALSHLFLAWRARALLGLVGSTEVERLVGTAYRRTLQLAGDIGEVKEERHAGFLKSLVLVRQVVVSARGETAAIDGDLFDFFVEGCLGRQLPPLLAGAIAGMAFLAGRIDGPALAARVRGQFGGAHVEPKDNVAAISGVIAVSPDLLIRKVVDDIMQRLRSHVVRALAGRRNRFEASPHKVMRNLDWRGTIRRNLKSYDKERRVLVPERVRFFSRARRRFPWMVILCIDQSGSMASSVIYSAVMAAIISGLPSLRLHIVVFDTSVVDLTDRASDPVEVLLSVQLGGGTDIGSAVAYCERLIVQPSRTILVLVTDFFEGASPARLIQVVRRLAEARVRMLGLAALDETAKPDFDRALAKQLAEQGMQIGAMTPLNFAEWLAEAIK